MSLNYFPDDLYAAEFRCSVTPTKGEAAVSAPTYPPTILVAEGFLDQMRQQLFAVRHRYRRDPMFPGWTFKDTNSYDQTVLRYDDEDGNFWLWELTGQWTADGYYQIAQWKD